MNEREIVETALQKVRGECPAFLDQTCGGDSVLRRRVEELLKAEETVRGLSDVPTERASTLAGGDDTSAGLDRPSASRATVEYEMGPPATAELPQLLPISEGPGTSIGPYRLLQKIGEGGMGTVYMAEQEKPVRRRVALKIIKPGMDTRQVVARFEAERQALALMDHPSIAKVLDAGSTSAWRRRGSGGWPAVLRHGAGQRDPDHRVLRRTPGSRPRERLELFVAGVPGDPACASEGDHPPRHQAVERARDA